MCLKIRLNRIVNVDGIIRDGGVDDHDRFVGEYLDKVVQIQ